MKRKMKQMKKPLRWARLTGCDATARVPGRPGGFTLIEVVFALAIFAFGFSILMMILPAGRLLEKSTQYDIEGDIYAKNGMAILKAKGMYDLELQLLRSGRAMDVAHVNIMAQEIDPSFQNAYKKVPSVPVYNGSNVGDGRVTNWDAEGCVYAWVLSSGAGANVNNNNAGFSWIPKQISGMYNLRPYLNTNGPTVYTSSTQAYGPWSGWTIWKRINGVDQQPGDRMDTGYTSQCKTGLCDMGDTTDLAMGKIHFLKNRPIPGFTWGYFSSLDFSFPSSVWTASGRSFIVHPLFWNQTTAYETTPDPSVQSVANPSWYVSTVALHMGSGDEWPELGDDDTATAGYLLRNDADNMRSVGVPPSSFGTSWSVYRFVDWHGDWASFHPAAYGITWPPTGGDPKNPTANLRAGALGGSSQTSRTGNFDPSGRCRLSHDSNGYTWISQDIPFQFFPNSQVGAPLREPPLQPATPYSAATLQSYDLNPDATGRYDYAGYSVPSLVRAYALVYDYSQNKILLRYPGVYGSANPSGDARIADFWKRYPAATTFRGLQPGDKFVGSPSGVIFTVNQVFSIQDEQAWARSVLPLDGSIDWSDGTYQVVSVSPNLSDTPYTPNKPCGLSPGLNTEKNDPPLYQALFAPVPVGGQQSPWQAVQSVPANGVIVRPADLFAE